jgi:hypothetical protein
MCQKALLAACFMLVSCLAYSSTLKMEKICSSETLVDFHRITWCYIPEHRTFRVQLDQNKVIEEYLLLGYDALHGVISQKKILFKTTAVKTSNHT